MVIVLGQNFYGRICYMIKKIILAIFFALALASNTVDATVGGSVTLYSFKYNPVDESVYYTRLSSGGRGCPPILEKISLTDGSVETVLSCDEGEQIRSNANDSDYSSGTHLVNQRINEITDGFKDLAPLSLRENNFQIDADFLREEYLGEEESQEFLIRRIFALDIYQDGELVGEKEVQACDLEEPFLFEGYSIPGFNEKIILLMSAKADCFEGGYVSDSIYVVAGVDNLDKNYYSNTIKGSDPIQPTKHTLIVYESETVSPDSSRAGQDSWGDDSSQDSKNDSGAENHINNIVIIIFVAVVSLVAGLLLGRISFKRK